MMTSCAAIRQSEVLYATRAEVLEYAFIPTRKDEEIQESAIARASRIVDTYVEVEPGYFAPACDLSEQCFEGSGDRWIELLPHVTGSIADVAYDDSTMTPEWIARDGYLIARKCLANPCCCSCCALEFARWEECKQVCVSAKWGWERTPDDIVEATISIVIQIWRGRDTAYARVVADVNTGTNFVYSAIPDRAKLILDKWRRKNKIVVV